MSLTLSRTIIAGPTEPCGLWQSEQDTLPSRIGWREGRLICARCSLWQVKHTSGWVSLSRTLSCAVCTWWQEVQATSRLACMLLCQWMRLPPWWQVRQASFCACGGVGDVLSNTRPGAGRSLASAGLLMCDSLSPWQLVQVGVRTSATVPCFVLPMARTG